jgi:hypothetical protein
MTIYFTYFETFVSSVCVYGRVEGGEWASKIRNICDVKPYIFAADLWENATVVIAPELVPKIIEQMGRVA